VLPRYRGIKLERYGNVRWIAVHASAAWVWARSQKFLKQAGLDIAHARPKEGFMETEWGARAPNVPLNFINSIFRAHVDSSVRYRFRLRLERDPKADGIIDVYLTEQRAQKATEKNTTYRESGGAVWQPVKTDPDVEALMLARLMVALGDARNSAQAAVQNPPQNQPLIRIGQTGNGNAAALEIKAPFADDWRAVQAALDRTAAQVDPKPRAAKFLVETTHNMSFSLSLQPANQYTRVYIKTHSDAPTDAALRLARQLRSALT
jgi:outer membrane protein assembly factor BamC